jgi:acyl-CoA synthetase (AMP-forming)/AMP-acid ligase II
MGRIEGGPAWGSGAEPWGSGGGCGRCRGTWPTGTGPKAGGDVDRAARSLAGSLQSKGVGPGDVVVIQLPNWAEAGIAFWAAAYLGAVVVPIVHFYGAKEVDYILRSTAPDVVVTADHFGHADYLDVYETLLAGSSASQWLVVGDTPDADLPRAATPFTSQLQGPPLAAPLAVDPDAPAIVAFTSGTRTGPSGARPASSTTSSRPEVRPRSPEPPSVTSSAC